MIRLVLDTSAIRDYAAGSTHVGEPISEVHDEGGQVAVPVVCLAEAARHADDHMLSLLAQHQATTLVPLLVDCPVRIEVAQSGLRLHMILHRPDLPCTGVLRGGRRQVAGRAGRTGATRCGVVLRSRYGVPNVACAGTVARTRGVVMITVRQP